jgi:transcriptional regulator with XRE-family HTH domain
MRGITISSVLSLPAGWMLLQQAKNRERLHLFVDVLRAEDFCVLNGPVALQQLVIDGGPHEVQNRSLACCSGCPANPVFQEMIAVKLPRYAVIWFSVGGRMMDGIGPKLRAFRQECGLSLREVEERSLRIAEDSGRASHRISASWLDRVERDVGELSFAKFMALATVYGIPPTQMLEICSPLPAQSLGVERALIPNSTILLTGGPLDEKARIWIPDAVVRETIPDETLLLPRKDHMPSHFRRGIIGHKDKTLDPMIRAGSIMLINTQRRAIAHRREWTHEFDRPIYFLITRTGYLCGWCELDKKGEWLTLVPHPMSYASAERWRHRKDVEVIGRVAFAQLRLVEPEYLG